MVPDGGSDDDDNDDEKEDGSVEDALALLKGRKGCVVDVVVVGIVAVSSTCSVTAAGSSSSYAASVKQDEAFRSRHLRMLCRSGWPVLLFRLAMLQCSTLRCSVDFLGFVMVQC